MTDESGVNGGCSEKFALSERLKTRVTEIEGEMKKFEGEMKEFEGEMKKFEGEVKKKRRYHL